MNTILESIHQIALQAGAAIMEYSRGEFDVTEKSDKSPVTAADLAANKIIVEALHKLTPDFPILSEESTHADWQERQLWKTFWLVDPLDGTKEFIKGNGEFTVNIALIINGAPALAVVYAPALEKSWLGDGQSAWLETKSGREKIHVQQQPIPNVVGSRSHPSPDMAAYLKKIGECKLVSVGSSLKFCLLAEGSAQIYPRLGPTMLWDTAAGHCIVESAGGKVTQLDGLPLQYHREALVNPYFICYETSFETARLVVNEDLH